MRTITATYRSYTHFTIPSDVPLLSIEENTMDKFENEVPWSWYIRYDTLIYYCNEGKEHEIEAFDTTSQKFPDDCTSDDDGIDEE